MQASARADTYARQPVTLVPELDQDVHDLRGLLKVADRIVPIEENGRRSGRVARA